MRTPWTQADVDAFVRNHEAILAAHDYPIEIRTELRRARRKWLDGVRIAHQEIPSP